MPGDEAELLRRSFRVAGHQTSLSMERAFWDEFRRLAQAAGQGQAFGVGLIVGVAGHGGVGSRPCSRPHRPDPMAAARAR